MNAFVSSQFNYCPLLWMCHNRSLNTQINKIHHRALSIVYRDNTSSFDTLLEKSGTVSIHHRNIQSLAIEIFKSLNNLSPSLISELFKMKETKYDLRTGNQLKSNVPCTTSYGIDSVSYLASKIWSQVTIDIKNCNTLDRFKKMIKTWAPRSCPCRLPRGGGGGGWYKLHIHFGVFTLRFINFHINCSYFSAAGYSIGLLSSFA